ncbi:MAG: hypothetical protein HY040_25820 [Planctomycetes bacterium]|nr:hypothetical protein [Planctomycetota bacterium]
MDHKEQHHQHHIHEREHKKAEKKEHDREQEKDWLPFHPAWLVVAGAGLVLVAILIWTLILS